MSSDIQAQQLENNISSGETHSSLKEHVQAMSTAIKNVVTNPTDTFIQLSNTTTGAVRKVGGAVINVGNPSPSENDKTSNKFNQWVKKHAKKHAEAMKATFEKFKNNPADTLNEGVQHATNAVQKVGNVAMQVQAVNDAATGIHKNVVKPATDAVKSVGHIAIGVHNTTTKPITDKLAEHVTNFHNAVTKPAMDAAISGIQNVGKVATNSLNVKTTGKGEEKVGGVFETLVYGEENNSPQFYKPNNTKTILVVILFLLLIIILIVIYYYSSGKIESFSFKRLFSNKRNVYRR